MTTMKYINSCMCVCVCRVPSIECEFIDLTHVFSSTRPNFTFVPLNFTCTCYRNMLSYPWIVVCFCWFVFLFFFFLCANWQRTSAEQNSVIDNNKNSQNTRYVFMWYLLREFHFERHFNDRFSTDRQLVSDREMKSCMHHMIVFFAFCKMCMNKNARNKVEKMLASFSSFQFVT